MKTYTIAILFAIMAFCLAVSAFPDEAPEDDAAVEDAQQMLLALVPSDDMDTEATKWHHWGDKHGYDDKGSKWAKHYYYKFYKPHWYKH